MIVNMISYRRKKKPQCYFLHRNLRAAAVGHFFTYSQNDTLRPCIHRMFPCGVCPCESVTRSNDGGRNSTTSQHTTIQPLIDKSLSQTL